MAKMYGLARIGRDAELRFTSANEPVCSLSLAFSYGRKGEDGNRPTQWVDGALWGKRAESLAQHLTKGTLVEVTLDEVHVETFQGKNGEGHKLAGRVTDVEFAGGGKTEGATPQRPAPQPAARHQPKPAPKFSDMDDDIPF